jgi:hypothetical protein
MDFVEYRKPKIEPPARTHILPTRKWGHISLSLSLSPSPSPKLRCLKTVENIILMITYNIEVCGGWSRYFALKQKVAGSISS